MDLKIIENKKQVLGLSIFFSLSILCIFILSIFFKTVFIDWILAFLFFQLIFSFYIMGKFFLFFRKEKKGFNLFIAILFMLGSLGLWIAISIINQTYAVYTGTIDLNQRIIRFACFCICGGLTTMGFVFLFNPLLNKYA